MVLSAFFSSWHKKASKSCAKHQSRRLEYILNGFALLGRDEWPRPSVSSGIYPVPKFV